MQKLTALATQSAPPIRVRRTEVSEALAAVVHHMLAKNADDRFATPAEAAAALQPFAAASQREVAAWLPEAIRLRPVVTPVNTLGIRRIMFAVDENDVVVTRMCDHGAELISQMQYADSYRLAYIRGTEGIIVALAEQLS